MAAGPHGVPTFPVWVGSLKDTIKEKDLQRICSRYGAIASCKVMKDEYGKSKRFGYVNYYSEADAERAAEKLAGFPIQGIPLKTKGPRLLQAQGHFSVLHHAPVVPQVNYRPLTDCSFFILGAKCKKGTNVSNFVIEKGVAIGLVSQARPDVWKMTYGDYCQRSVS